MVICVHVFLQKNHPWNEALQVSQIILLEVEVVLGIIAVSGVH